MRVAFATRDGEHVNEQLRRAPVLAVYEVTASGHRLDRTCEFPPERPLGTDDRIHAIADSAVAFVSAVGPSIAARLAARGIRAATAPAGTRIRDLLEQLSALLAAAAGPRSDRECQAP